VADKIGRRDFLKKSAAAGAAAVLGNRLVSGLADGPLSALAAANIDIAVTSGSDYAAMTAKAVEVVGGMEKFVHKGSKVALLPNVQSKNPGTFTKPDILRAVIRMCKKAGAGEINCLSWLTQQHWDGAGLAQVVQEEGITLKLIPRDDINFKAVPITGGSVLQEAKILNEFFNHDVFINMPITKNHVGNKFTGTMKNLMGLNSPAFNRAQFHMENWQTDPAAIEHLDRCIADLNTVIKPSLCVVDATEIIKTNGPMGPGELIRPLKVIAGVDRVAIDSYCATLLGLKGEELAQIRGAYEKKLGEIDLKKVKIQEIKV
jgi:uncharacterized protein (DUF362 family)